jgi:glycerophosphoryl diester phosphodiesterase
MPVGWISLLHFLPNKPVELIGALWPVFFLNLWYVHTAQKKGMFVCPLDPTPEPRLKFYLDQNVDAVLSDNPAKTRSALDSLMSSQKN